jgi:hypothetical protein
MRNRINTANRVNTANRINTRSRVNTANRLNMVNRFNMLSRFVDTQRIGSGVGSGIVNTPNRFTIHGPITIRTTGTLSGITAVDIAVVVVDTPVVDIAAAVVEDTPVAVTPVVVTVAIRNGGNVRISPDNHWISPDNHSLHADSTWTARKHRTTVRRACDQHKDRQSVGTHDPAIAPYKRHQVDRVRPRMTGMEKTD